MPVVTKLWQGRYIHWGTSSINSHNPLITCSREILHLLYLYCSKAYGHQIWQGGDLLWETSTYKVTQLFEHVVTWGYVVNLNITSTTRMPMATKPCRFVTFSEEPPSTKSENSVTRWSCKVTWQIDYVIFPLPQWLWLPNMAGWFYILKTFSG